MSQISSINVPYEELKHLILDVIRRSGDSFQFKGLCNGVGHSAVSKNIVANPNPPNFQTFEYPLQKADENRVREVLWDLIIERVLTVGDHHNDSWPWLSVTAYGKKALDSTDPIPNDSTGYLARIKKEVPQLDTVIETYLIESIRTYNINQLLSSTITIGCASEKCLLVLIETFTKSFRDANKRLNFEKKIEGKFIKTQYDEFNKAMHPTRPQLPYSLREPYENRLNGVFDLIRNNRNGAGHPTGKQVDKDTLFSSLQVFIPYCKYVYDLKDFLDKNQHD